MTSRNKHDWGASDVDEGYRFHLFLAVGGGRLKILHPWSLTASLPLKNGGWKTILSFWDGTFSETMLNFGRVQSFDSFHVAIYQAWVRCKNILSTYHGSVVLNHNLFWMTYFFTLNFSWKFWTPIRKMVHRASSEVPMHTDPSLKQLDP